jgi:hypothetical protein
MASFSYKSQVHSKLIHLLQVGTLTEVSGGAKRSPMESRIMQRVRRAGRGWVFTPADFLDLGSREAVDTTLHRLAAAGKLRKIARGIYDYPKLHPKLGALAPAISAVVEAVADRHGIRVQPSGAYATNLLGLSEQVPTRVTYLTDGPSRVIRIGKQQLQFKRTTPRNMITAGRISGLVFQALRHIGRANVTDHTKMTLAQRLNEVDRQKILQDVQYAPGWISAVVRDLPKSQTHE